MVLRGRVRTGFGNFGHWIERLGEHYQRKTGVRLYPGTLNVELDVPYRLPEDVMRLEKEEYGGTVSVSLVECRFFGRAAWVLRTDRNATGEGPHPLTIVEIASEIRLRDAYGLKDGDVVEVEVPPFG